VQRDGFLTDYYLLRERDGTPRPVWVNPNADFALYDRVLFDPVTVWGNDVDSSVDVPVGVLHYLCWALLTSTRDDVTGRGIAIVSAPGRGVLRIRLAITEAASAPNLIATVMPTAGAATVEPSPATRARMLAARIEGEITDSITGEVLCVAAQPLDQTGDANERIEQLIAEWAAQLAGVIRRDPGQGEMKRGS
jgi:hypothetical protein